MQDARRVTDAGQRPELPGGTLDRLVQATGVGDIKPFDDDRRALAAQRLHGLHGLLARRPAAQQQETALALIEIPTQHDLPQGPEASRDQVKPASCSYRVWVTSACVGTGCNAGT